MLLLSGLKESGVKTSHIVFAGSTLVLGLLAGSRADFLPQLFILLILGFNKSLSGNFSAASLVRLISLLFLGVIFLAAGYFSAIFVALWRTGIPIDSALDLLTNSAGNLLFRDKGPYQVLYLETGNMMLGGFYAAIVNVSQSGYLFGSSYFDYLLKAPPAFLGLPRPLGLEWAANINGLTMSQGGIFEVAEAYWNFGFIGCFIISFMLSYFFGWLLQKGLLGNNYFFLTWYIVFGFHSFRSIWYQNFSYFRLLTIMLLIYVAGRLFVHWFVTRRAIYYPQLAI